MYFRQIVTSALLGVFVTLGLSAQVQPANLAQPQNRVTEAVTASRMVTLSGNIHPLIASSPSQAAQSSLPLQKMILSLKSDATQNSTLEQLLAKQQDPKSPLYHQFLTPQNFGNQFGISASDLSKVVSWLQANGFTIDQIAASHRSIIFSGTASQVATAFNTQIRQYSVAGVTHVANANDPQIPAALAEVVSGIVKLHNFQHTPSLSKGAALTNAQFTSSTGAHYLSPADYSTIYNLKSLYSAGVDGTGQSIAVIARSNITLSDVESFRQSFGLPANDPQMVIVNSDPGVVEGDATETTLDTEWSGAVAPKATIKVVTASSTNSADGIDLAAEYAVDNNVAPVITLSYGSCEAYMGSAGTAFYNALWQQAAAQGITVLVSAGDAGAAGCNGGSDSTASMTGVNGLCTSPYSTCVGGTEFNEGTNPGQYWYPGNNSVYGSALSYIPESVWNESSTVAGGSGLWSGGGGASLYFSKPSWQTGPGVPADGKRDVPDVSLSASGHDGYIIVEYGNMYSVGGTSAAAPSFAGMMALVDQKVGIRQGNANPILYPLAISQAAGGASVFHDIKSGNNSVPGVTGFSATIGFDMASGLGSVDAYQLANHWTDNSKPVTPTITLEASATSLSLKAGTTQQVTITSTASSTLKSAVTLSVSGSLTGINASFATSTIASPGTGSVALTVATASAVKPGTYTFNVNAQGGGQSATLAITVVVPTPSFTLTAKPSLSAFVGDSAALALALSPVNGFNSPVTMSIHGLPASVTSSFSTPTMNGVSVATSNLVLTLAKTAVAGSYPLTITATGGGVTQTVTVTLIVSVHASCTLTANPGSLKLTGGQSATVQVACGAVQGSFSGPLSFTISGQPGGVTATLASSSVKAGATTTLSVASTLLAPAGISTLTIAASGAGFTQSLALPLTIATPATFTLTSNEASLTAKPGTSGQVALTTAHIGSFNSTVALSVTRLPSGVTASFTHSSLPAPGDGASTVTFALAANTKPGTYPLTITAVGGGVTQTLNLSLVVPSPADFSFAVSTTAITLTSGGAPVNETVSTGNFTGGFNSTITITYNNLAPGMNWKYVSGNTANNLVNNTVGLYAATSTLPGVYPITVSATGAGITHSAVVNVTILAPSTAAKK